MTIEESRAFVVRFLAAAGDLLQQVEVVLYPPYTALHAVAQLARHARVELGGQNVSAEDDDAHTGQISARLLADAGCQWVLVGHWEVRRDLGDTDLQVNRRLQRALEAGLRPVLSVGEGRGRQAAAQADLERQLPVVLGGVTAAQVGAMVFLYEPEWTVGAAAPAAMAHVEAGCRTIRLWLRAQYGNEAAEAARVIYGGSVTQAYAAELLQAPDVDGLGAGRQGRDAESWAAVVRLVAEARAPQRSPFRAVHCP